MELRYAESSLDNFQPSVIYMRCNWFDTQPAAARNFPGRVIKKERKKRRKGERERERKKTSRLVITRVLTFYFLDADTVTVLI